MQGLILLIVFGAMHLGVSIIIPATSNGSDNKSTTTNRLIYVTVIQRFLHESFSSSIIHI